MGIFIEVPMKRPDGIPPMKKLEDILIEPAEGEVIDPNAEPRTNLPPGATRNATAQINMEIVVRVDDVGIYDSDGLFRQESCIVYFAIPSLPPLAVEMTKDKFMSVLQSTAQNVHLRMREMKQNQILQAGQLPTGMG